MGLLTPNQRMMCRYKIIPSNMGSFRAANVLKTLASSAVAMVIRVTCLRIQSVSEWSQYHRITMAYQS